MIGKVVFEKAIHGLGGTNTMRINTDELTPGVYMLSLDNGVAIHTRRMIVSRK